MSELFDDLNKTLKKDLIPILIKYLKDPNNKIADNLNDFMYDPQIFLKDILEKVLKNKNNDNNQENFTDIDPVLDDEYDELLNRLILIKENMKCIEKVLKEKNEKY